MLIHIGRPQSSNFGECTPDYKEYLAWHRNKSDFTQVNAARRVESVYKSGE